MFACGFSWFRGWVSLFNPQVVDFSQGIRKRAAQSWGLFAQWIPVLAHCGRRRRLFSVDSVANILRVDSFPTIVLFNNRPFPWVS